MATQLADRFGLDAIETHAAHGREDWDPDLGTENSFSHGDEKWSRISFKKF